MKDMKAYSIRTVARTHIQHITPTVDCKSKVQLGHIIVRSKA